MARRGLANPPQEDILELARKTRELIELCWDHPSMDVKQPERSPKMLWHVGDFLRRTYTDYIAPLLPASMASLEPRIAFADPRCQDPRRGMPGGPPRSPHVIHDEEAQQAWPRFDSEKYTDALMRNMMAETIILKPNDLRVRMMFAGGDSGFDFGEEIKEKARKLNKDDKRKTKGEEEGNGEGVQATEEGAQTTGEGVQGMAQGGDVDISGKKARNAKKREKKKEKKNAAKNQGDGEGKEAANDEAAPEAGTEGSAKSAPAGGNDEAEWETA